MIDFTHRTTATYTTTHFFAIIAVLLDVTLKCGGVFSTPPQTHNLITED